MRFFRLKFLIISLICKIKKEAAAAAAVVSLYLYNLFLDNKHNWKSSIIKSRYDTFITKLTKEGKPESNQNVNSTKEKFLAHIHNGIMISQNFIKK